MKSASALSKEIRAKKKQMKDPSASDAVDLSGIPMDATDEEIMHQESLTSDLGLDSNEPKEHDEEPTAHQELMADSHDRQVELKKEAMPLKHYASGGMVGGRGAIAGGSVPKHTELAKVNGFAEGGEMDEAKKKRMARLAKMKY